jgi:hypothetical protein
LGAAGDEIVFEFLCGLAKGGQKPLPIDARAPSQRASTRERM